jgi:hypothetical protein
MSKTLVLFALILLSSTRPVDKPVSKINVISRASAADINGNVYAIDEAYNLILFKGGETIRRISLANQGASPVIDASNQLELFVFYPSNGQALCFDNQLNGQGSIDLFKAGIAQCAAAGRANDGQIWVLDNNTKTLKKIDRQGSLLQESMVISDFSIATGFQRVYDNGELMAFQEDNGDIHVFDRSLVFMGKLSGYGKLMGLRDEEIITANEGFLLAQNPNTTPPKADTLAVYTNTGTLSDYNGEFYLTADSSSLTLYRTNR